MVVVFTVGQGLQVVATVEEFRDVSASASFDDELATWVVGCVVSSVKYEVIKKEEMALPSARNSVELFLSHNS